MGFSSPVLNLRRWINDPAALDRTRSAVALDDRDPPTLLVYGEPLATLLLRCESARTYDLVAHWKVIARGVAMPVVESLFRHTPFMLHGDGHQRSRKALLAQYRAMQEELDGWLPAVAEAFFASLDPLMKHGPVPLCEAYVGKVFGNMLARELDVPAGELEACGLPSENLFAILPRADSARRYEAQLSRLLDFARRALAARGRDPERAWGLLSVVVMGREPVLGALVYGLLHPAPPGGWSAAALLRESAPVSLLGRTMEEDVTIDGYDLRRGQSVHVAPFLAHRMRGGPDGADESRSIEFGAGRHACAGRVLAQAVVEAFLAAAKRRPPLSVEQSGVRMVRDFVLLPKEAV